MIRIVCIIILLQVVLLVQAQTYTGVKVYAYRQPVVSGVNPGGIIDESGKEVTTARSPRFNTRVYVTHSPKVMLNATEVYINGIKHEVKVDNITKTPVTFSSSNILDKTEKELVPKTGNKVLLLTPTRSVTSQPNSCVRKLIANNNVIVGYTIKGKKYYTAVKDFTRLEPAVMQ